MKRLLVILWLLFALTAVSAFAGSVTLIWDPQPTGEAWQFVRIYERLGTTAPYTFTKVAEVSGTLTTATVSGVLPGTHTYIARSFQVLESADSNAVPAQALPSSPHLAAAVTVTVP